MASQFRVDLVDDSEIPDLVQLIVPTFAIYSVEQQIGNVDTPAGIKAATERHLHSAKLYKEETGRLCAVKCIDIATGAMAACAYWYIYPQPRPAKKSREGPYLVSASWLEGEQKEKALKTSRPVIEKQAKWTMGRPYALLMYMATDPTWRRKGAATAVVKCGLERCRELGVMAYLEASETGRPVYEALGFEVVDLVECEVEGRMAVFPAMVWWPPGTAEEEKRPAAGE